MQKPYMLIACILLLYFIAGMGMLKLHALHMQVAALEAEVNWRDNEKIGASIAYEYWMGSSGSFHIEELEPSEKKGYALITIHPNQKITIYPSQEKITKKHFMQFYRENRSNPNITWPSTVSFGENAEEKIALKDMQTQDSKNARRKDSK